jgi:mono/diheme cytochrome c family protein
MTGLRRTVHTLLGLVAVGSVLAFGAALAQTPPEVATPPSEGSAFNGKVSYKVFCSNCHGEAGKGDGKLAELLRQPPTDLTAIAANNGGEFPATRVRRLIDGTTDVKGHGQREMPVWGDAFVYPEDTPEKRVEAQGKISDLVAYLRSIQAPASK